MIVQLVDECVFRKAFWEYGSEGMFSYDGLGVLYWYLEELSEEIGEPIDLDVIALCCDFCEYTWDALRDEYGLRPEDFNEDEWDDVYIDDLVAHFGDDGMALPVGVVRPLSLIHISEPTRPY